MTLRFLNRTFRHPFGHMYRNILFYPFHLFQYRSSVFEIKRLADDKEILLESRRMNKLQMSKLYDEMSSFMTDERERLGREMTNRLISKLQAQQKEQGSF